MYHINHVQTVLRREKIEGWLLYHFKHNNRVAASFMGFKPNDHLTRRIFYWIPQTGEPVVLVHQVERDVVAHLQGRKELYSDLDSLKNKLYVLLKEVKSVAMEYSAECCIPMLSQVDAGTIEMIRKMGIEVISSASFLQYLTCCWSPRQLELHRQAAQVLDHTANACWEWIESRLKTSVSTTEYDIQQFILDQIVQAGCEADTAPICGINQNSANPHYAPSSTKYITLKVGDWILIDLWCKKKEAHAVYADITRVAVASHRPTPLQEQLFSVVSSAQKQATEFVRRKIEAGEEIRGWEVDRVARNVVESAGFGNYFIHRTGHNIHEENHGPGANMDSYETYDDRRIIPNTCFSIEPGIYLTNQFGVRLEYDVFIHADKRIELNGGVQDSIVCLD